MGFLDLDAQNNGQWTSVWHPTLLVTSEDGVGPLNTIDERTNVAINGEGKGTKELFLSAWNRSRVVETLGGKRLGGKKEAEGRGRKALDWRKKCQIFCNLRRPRS